MCGIIGYAGRSRALPILVEGIRLLSYRGYDSAGVAILDGEGLHVIASLAEEPSEWGLAVSPDGRTVLFVGDEFQSDIMLVENFR